MNECTLGHWWIQQISFLAKAMRPSCHYHDCSNLFTFVAVNRHSKSIINTEQQWWKTHVFKDCIKVFKLTLQKLWTVGLPTLYFHYYLNCCNKIPTVKPGDITINPLRKTRILNFIQWWNLIQKYTINRINLVAACTAQWKKLWKHARQITYWSWRMDTTHTCAKSRQQNRKDRKS